MRLLVGISILLACLTFFLLGIICMLYWQYGLPTGNNKGAVYETAVKSVIREVTPTRTHVGTDARARWAFSNYALAIMKYEIANGTLGDAELVGTVFMKRLNAEAKRCKECTSSQLAERVGTRWNPNQHSSMHAIMRHIESNREQAFMKQAIKNILNGNLETDAGKAAEEHGATHFYHVNQKNKHNLPSYYKTLPSRLVTLDNKFPTWIAKEF